MFLAVAGGNQPTANGRVLGVNEWNSGILDGGNKRNPGTPGIMGPKAGSCTNVIRIRTAHPRFHQPVSHFLALPDCGKHAKRRSDHQHEQQE